jgi:hypothetical protein
LNFDSLRKHEGFVTGVAIVASEVTDETADNLHDWFRCTQPAGIVDHRPR